MLAFALLKIQDELFTSAAALELHDAMSAKTESTDIIRAAVF
jgi:hypothetical protein